MAFTSRYQFSPLATLVQESLFEDDATRQVTDAALARVLRKAAESHPSEWRVNIEVETRMVGSNKVVHCRDFTPLVGMSSLENWNQEFWLVCRALGWSWSDGGF